DRGTAAADRRLELAACSRRVRGPGRVHLPQPGFPGARATHLHPGHVDVPPRRRAARQRPSVRPGRDTGPRRGAYGGRGAARRPADLYRSPGRRERGNRAGRSRAGRRSDRGCPRGRAGDHGLPERHLPLARRRRSNVRRRRTRAPLGRGRARDRPHRTARRGHRRPHRRRVRQCGAVLDRHRGRHGSRGGGGACRRCPRRRRRHAAGRRCTGQHAHLGCRCDGVQRLQVVVRARRSGTRCLERGAERDGAPSHRLDGSRRPLRLRRHTAPPRRGRPPVRVVHHVLRLSGRPPAVPGHAQRDRHAHLGGALPRARLRTDGPGGPGRVASVPTAERCRSEPPHRVAAAPERAWLQGAGRAREGARRVHELSGGRHPGVAPRLQHRPRSQGAGRSPHHTVPI
ncbi:MAG: hypothetical protein AVDCRST_MAG32-596, partial [uncultured Nocardioides sp.]